MKGDSLEDIRRARGITDTSALDRAYREIQLELPLAAIRKASGVRQSDIAKRLGKTQAAISKFEGRGDFLCSTLFRYARSIGADIDLKININDQVFDLVAKDYGDQIFFALVKKASVNKRDVNPLSNVVDLDEWTRASSSKRKMVPPAINWSDSLSTHSSPALSDLLFEMAGNDENKSATA